MPADEPGADLVQSKLTFEEVKLGYVLTMTRDFEGVGNLPLIDMPNTQEEYLLLKVVVSSSSIFMSSNT